MSKVGLQVDPRVQSYLDLWDGTVRGLPRPDGMDDSTWVVRQACLQDHTVFMQTIWKDRKGHRVKNARVHRIMGDFIDEARRRGVPALVLAPMGIGKSEQGQAYMLRMLAGDPWMRGGIVCDKGDHAGQRVSLIRRYMWSDPDFRRLFPDITLMATPSTRFTFRLSHNKTAKDESVEGAGVLSSGTGTRKEFIFADDCVTAKNAITEPAQRPRVIQSFEQTWVGRIVEDGWHYCIATLYHAADLWHRLMEKRRENGEWTYAVLRIGVSENFDQYDVDVRWPENPDFVRSSCELWEGVWDSEAYKNKYAQLVVDGDASAWFTGYRNMVIDPNAMAFHKKDFFIPTALRPRHEYPLVVMYADPASSDAVEADNYAGWVVGYDPFRQAAVVLDGWYDRRESLTKRVDRFLDMYEKWKPSIAAVEGKHEVSFAQRIEEVAAERGLNFRLRKVGHTRKKEERIGGLAPLIEKGKLLVDGNRFPWLWKEASLFPKARFDDALDALEGAWAQIRLWLRRRNMIGAGFDLDRQYDAQGVMQRAPGGTSNNRYVTPSLPAEDRPTLWSRVESVLFPE